MFRVAILCALLFLFPLTVFGSPFFDDESLELLHTFDYSEGKILYDQSSHERNARLNSGARLVTSEIRGKAAFFKKDKLKIPVIPLNFSSSELTVMFFAKITNTTLSQDDARFLAQGDGVAANDQQLMVSLHQGFPRVRIKTGGTTQTLIGTTPIPVNQYFHLAATYDGESINLYLDGELVGSQSATGDIHFGGVPFYIGNQPGSAGYQMSLKRGKIDSVAIYSTAKSLEEITALAGLQIDQNEPACGNLMCETSETELNCPADCQPSSSICGNDTIEPGEECEGNETSVTYASCQVNGYPGSQSMQSQCIAETCMFGDVTIGTCESDLYCGDQICSPGVENHLNCPQDCSDNSTNDDIPTLVPGNGQLHSVDVSSIGGSITQTVARWDVVPHSTFNGEFHIGIPAFHQTGINRVEFSVEGGPWSVVHEMVSNPDTCSSHDLAPVAPCVTEYTAKLRAQDFTTSGPIHVQAVAIPNAGVPRLLPTLNLNVDKGDLSSLTRYVSPSGADSGNCGSSSQQACRTINYALSTISAVQGGLVDRGRILLTEGQHQIGSMNYTTLHEYVTIESAPGSNRADTMIIGHGPSLNIKLLRIKNVTWKVSGSTTTSPAYSGHAIELNRVHMLGDGQFSSSGPGSYPWFSSAFPWDGGMSMIDCVVSNAKFGPTMSYLQRGTIIERIGEDVFRYPHALLNVKVTNVRPGNTGWHSDLIEISGGYTLDNAIFYGLYGIDINAQAIFTKAPGGALTQFKNSAIVNSMFEKSEGAWTSQFDDNSSVENIIFLNNTFPNFSLLFNTPLISNMHLRGNIFQKLSGSIGQNVQESWFHNNHFIDASSYGAITVGTGVSTGDPLFISPASNDFRLQESSPAKRSTSPIVPTDIGGHPRGEGEQTSLGVFE